MPRLRAIAGIALVLAMAGCGKKAAPEPVTPEEGAAGQAAAAVDSAALRAQAEAAERARRQAATDSAARAAANLLADLTRPVFFDYNEAAIRGGDAAVLDRTAAILLANPAVRVRIEGHCDERGSDEYNLALGNQRAIATRRYLEGRGVAGSRIEVVSYGEERPADAGHDEAAWAKNRRAEIVPLATGALVAPK